MPRLFFLRILFVSCGLIHAEVFRVRRSPTSQAFRNCYAGSACSDSCRMQSRHRFKPTNAVSSLGCSDENRHGGRWSPCGRPRFVHICVHRCTNVGHHGFSSFSLSSPSMLMATGRNPDTRNWHVTKMATPLTTRWKVFILKQTNVKLAHKRKGLWSV